MALDSEVLLHRQVHPNWFKNGVVSNQVYDVTSQTFNPTANHNLKLSVTNGYKLSPKQSYETHIVKGLQSVGVLTVTGAECDMQSLPYDEDNNPFDGHSVIDFNGFPTKDRKDKAKVLKKNALERNWTYRPLP